MNTLIGAIVLACALGCGGGKDPLEKARSYRTEICACVDLMCKPARDYATWLRTIDDDQDVAALSIEQRLEISKVQREIADCVRKLR